MKEESTFDNAIDAQIELTAIRQEVETIKRARNANRLADAKSSRAQHETNKKSLKSDVKKTSAFVKRVRVITSDGLQQCVRETESLNLSLYISEIVGAILETAYKATDVPALSKLCECLHKRYEDFTDSLLTGVKNSLLSTPSDEDKDALKRRRLQIRLLLELFFLGVFEDDTFFLQVIRMLLGIRRPASGPGSAVVIGASGTGGDGTSSQPINKKFADLQSLVTFVKFGSEHILGYPTARLLAAATAAMTPKGSIDVSAILPAELVSPNATTLPICLLASERTCEVARNLVLAAFQHLSNDLVAAHKDLRSKEKRFEKDKLLHGTLAEAKQATLDNAQRFFERLLPVMQSLSEALHQPLPELVEEPEEEAVSSKGISVFEIISKEAGSWGPHGDPETKAFYEDLPDLLTLVPLVYFNMTEAQAQAIREAWRQENTRLKEEEAVAASTQGTDDALEEPATDGSSADVGATISTTADSEQGVAEDIDGNAKRARLQQLLEERLPDCLTRSKVDEFCESLCYVNSKGARKRLLAALSFVPRGRTELVPNFARIVACFNRVYPGEFSEPLLEHLHKQFYGQLRAKNQLHGVADRIRTVRYIAELVKFRVAPPIAVFRCFQGLLADFVHHNVDVTAALLEHCGRFLYLKAHTHHRMAALLDTVLRLKAVRALDVRQSALLESAYFAVKPPEKTREVMEERTTIQKFVYYVLLECTSRRRGEVASTTVEPLVRSLRRLPWDDMKENVQWHVMQALLQLSESVYVLIPSAAAILTSLSKTHPNLLIRTVDHLIERVRRALHVPYRREPQKVLGLLRMLSALFMNGAVSSTLVYDMLYLVIHHGHEVFSADGVEQCTGILDKTTGRYRLHRQYDPFVQTDLDSPTDTFRALMVCEVLNACGGNFARPGTRTRLEQFLLYFQRWLLSKPTLPVHVEFAVLDLFDGLDVKAAEIAAPQKTAASGTGARGTGDKSIKRETLPAFSFKRYNSIEAANSAIQEMEKAEKESWISVQGSDAVDAEAEGGSDGEEIGDDSDESDDEKSLHEGSAAPDDAEEGENASNGGSDEGSSSGDSDSDASSDEEEDDDAEEGSESSDDSLEIAVRHGPQKTAAQLEEEDEFDRLFRQMQLESAETARAASKRTQVNLDRLAIPAILPRAKNLPVEGTTPAAPQNGMSFKLLSRDARGKVETRHVVIPDSADLAAKLQKRQESQREERQRNKEQVLALSELEQQGVRRPPRTPTAIGGGTASRTGVSDMGLDEFLNESSMAELRAAQEQARNRSRASVPPKPVLEPLRETNPNRERW